ncbi:IS3 family transposase [Flavobacterium cerinum]|uniref:IS3 family transposase n=1 Tax=Flavobacterium cerinum TaxID=2502784 RepID=UPI001F4F43A7|nr:IS3 family transposase [Flavobacterium cerinum]
MLILSIAYTGKNWQFKNCKRTGDFRFSCFGKANQKTDEECVASNCFQKKYRVTTNSSHKYPVAENILDREFSAKNENEVWVSDITYINASLRWLYLTVVIDLFDRTVIGWALSTSLATKQTSIKALEMALANRQIKVDSSLVFHSDRGIQYTCKEFVQEISKNKSVIRSMSRKGNCWDNAVCESFFKTLKVELIYKNNYKTKQEAEKSISEYIKTFYNTQRRHTYLDNLTIPEYTRYNQMLYRLGSVASVCKDPRYSSTLNLDGQFTK